MPEESNQQQFHKIPVWVMGIAGVLLSAGLTFLTTQFTGQSEKLGLLTDRVAAVETKSEVTSEGLATVKATVASIKNDVKDVRKTIEGLHIQGTELSSKLSANMESIGNINGTIRILREQIIVIRDSAIETAVLVARLQEGMELLINLLNLKPTITPSSNDDVQHFKDLLGRQSESIESTAEEIKAIREWGPPAARDQ